MAPRGRPRRPGRADVAIEHMRIMGFENDKICRELKNLLKIYGEDGWWFIESDAYKVLIEVLLDAQEKGAQPENGLGNGNLLEMEPVDTNVVAIPKAAYTGPSHPHHSQAVEDIEAPPHRRRQPCYGWIYDDDDEEEDDMIELSPALSVFK